MATSEPATSYVRISGFDVWWDGMNSVFLQSSSRDPQLPEGTMVIVFSNDPRSADYHPVNFNECVAVLLAHGKPAPEPVEEHPRDLHLRPRLSKSSSLSASDTDDTESSIDELGLEQPPFSGTAARRPARRPAGS